MKNYYIAENGDRKGPFTEQQLKGMLKYGSISKGTLVWTDGIETWAKAGDMPFCGKTGGKKTPVGAIICIAVTVILIIVLTPVIIFGSYLIDKKNKAAAENCRSNLQQIITAVNAYKHDNGGRYPENLDVLVKTGDLSEVFQVCVDKKTNYRYLPNGENKVAGKTHLVICPKHKNVIWADGKVSALCPSGYDKDIADELNKDMQRLKNEAVSHLLNAGRDVFTGGGEIFSSGANEIVFAWIEDADFSADSLNKASESQGKKRVFEFSRICYFVKCRATLLNAATSEIWETGQEDYPYSCSLIVNFSNEITSGKDVEGLKLCAVIPSGYKSLSAAERESWKRNYILSMPNRKFDYAVAFGRNITPEVASKQSVYTLRWSKAEKRWEFEESLDDFTPAPVPHSDSDEELNQEMKSKGWTKVNGKWILNSDVQTLKNIDAGLVFFEKQWVKESVMQQTLALRRAAAEIKNNAGLDEILEYLHVFAATPQALQPERDMAKMFCEDALKTIINKYSSSRDLDAVFAIQKKIANNSDFRQLDTAMLKKICAEAVDSINAANEKNMQALKMLDQSEQDLTVLAQLEKKVPGLLSNSDFETYCFFVQIKNGNKENYNKLRECKYTVGGYDCGRTCQECKGEGIVPQRCNYCHGTGICSLCHGSGSRMVTRSSYENRRFVEWRESVTCSEICSSCRGRKVTCPSCRGTARVLDKGKFYQVLAEIREKLKNIIKQQ